MSVETTATRETFPIVYFDNIPCKPIYYDDCSLNWIVLEWNVACWAEGFLETDSRVMKRTAKMCDFFLVKNVFWK